MFVIMTSLLEASYSLCFVFTDLSLLSLLGEGEQQSEEAIGASNGKVRTRKDGCDTDMLGH